jgi:beta-mannosidase
MASFRASHHAPIDGWSVLATAGDAHPSPADLPAGGWDTFEVPGTIASALRARRALTDAAAHAIDTQDHWLRTRLAEPLSGLLVFDGLATVSEIWIDGEKRAEGRSMFEPVSLDVDLAAGAEIAICFRALDAKLAAAPKRSRWRPQMIQPNGLRWFRTTALGSTPGWSPPGRPTGPWRPIWRIDGALPKIDVRTVYEGGVGRVRVTVEREGADGLLHCAGLTAPLLPADDRLVADLTLPAVAPWFPHTHGEPSLHDLSIALDGQTFDLGRVGFRSIEVDRDTDGDGFGLVINGVPVFARGACWSSADAISLAGSREAYEPWLRLAREAGMNMIRVPGVMAYETDDFFALCDELGIMVWQEAMLANFDYPQADEAFRESVRREAESFLDRTQTNACLTVFCGGSEVFQQAAMLGAPVDAWGGPVFDEVLPTTLAKLRPDVPYVPNSPSGGHLPFIADQRVTHYYGVGAYRRPVEDARRARVRFASECLAFSNVPEDVSLARARIAPVTHTPDWKRGVPRDMGASWDFEDVRDHYVERLYGVSTLELKREDPERYFALSRAAVAEVLEETYAEFRRPGSATRGALVWLLQDLMPGAGWGVIASDGEPKSAWHALKRAFRPVQLSITDEGVNGIALHVINERPEPLEAEIALICWRDGAAPVVTASRAVSVPSREAKTLSAFELIGRFFDISYAYKFGPPSHDVTSATLTCAKSGALIAEAFHFPLGRALPKLPLGLSARVEGDADAPVLVLKTERFAQSANILDEAWRPTENWLHLAPGREKRIALVARKEGAGAPSGLVRALNGLDEASY